MIEPGTIKRVRRAEKVRDALNQPQFLRVNQPVRVLKHGCFGLYWVRSVGSGSNAVLVHEGNLR